MSHSTGILVPCYDIRAVAFDLDGTIVPTYERGVEDIREIAKRRGLSFNEETIRRIKLHWGVPGAELLAICFDISIEYAHEVYKDWTIVEHENPLLPIRGAASTIRSLHARGVKCGLVTSRTRDSLTPTLGRMSFRNLFHHTAAKDETAGHKPDPKVFTCWLAFCAGHDILPHQVAYVGDGHVDITAANEAGMISIAVETGPKHQLDSVSPHVRLSTIAKVGPWLLQQSMALA